MHGTERILVVEDDPQVAEIICWNLRSAGYPVTVVADGLEAMQAFDREHPALVTVDLMIPTVSGFRLVALFKRERPEVPVLVVTALAFEEAEETAHAGADDFITKPFDPATLVQKIDDHLHRAPLPAVGGAGSLGEAEVQDAERARRDIWRWRKGRSSRFGAWQVAVQGGHRQERRLSGARSSHSGHRVTRLADHRRVDRLVTLSRRCDRRRR